MTAEQESRGNRLCMNNMTKSVNKIIGPSADARRSWGTVRTSMEVGCIDQVGEKMVVILERVEGEDELELLVSSHLPQRSKAVI